MLSVRKPIPGNWPRRTSDYTAQILEPTLVFLISGALYISLYADLPYHDVGRFVSQIKGGQYVWDMGHVWLQPVTLLWHQYLGFGEAPEASQKHINTVFAASGIATFDYAMLQLRISFKERLWSLILLAMSSSILTLAPTAHMKLLAFPFLTGSLFATIKWEQQAASHYGALCWAGCLLATATAFHSSCLAAAPFVAVAIVLTCRRNGES